MSGEKVDLCANCPKRTRIGSFLARMAFMPRVAEGCGGSVRVLHGVVTIQRKSKGEPAPPAETWSMLIGNPYGDRRYIGTSWETDEQKVCGRDAASKTPRLGEVPYDATKPIYVDAKGQRTMPFISGDPEGLGALAGHATHMRMLDAVTELQIAEARGETATADGARQAIASEGLVLRATVGRDDGAKYRKS